MRILCAFVLIITLYSFSSAPVTADVVLTPVVDGDILDANGDGIFESFDTFGSAMSVRNFPNIVVERAVMEFDISSIPSSATIDSVVMSIGNVGIANAPLQIGFRGFEGNGALTISDATTATNLLAVEPWSTLETRQIDLGTSYLQSILGSSNFLGIRLQDAASNANIQFATSESSFGGRRPSLTIEFTVVPEPTTATLFLFASVVAVRHRRSRSR